MLSASNTSIVEYVDENVSLDGDVLIVKANKAVKYEFFVVA